MKVSVSCDSCGNQCRTPHGDPNVHRACCICHDKARQAGGFKSDESDFCYRCVGYRITNPFKGLTEDQHAKRAYGRDADGKPAHISDPWCCKWCPSAILVKFKDTFPAQSHARDLIGRFRNWASSRYGHDIVTLNDNYNWTFAHFEFAWRAYVSDDIFHSYYDDARRTP